MNPENTQVSLADCTSGAWRLNVNMQHRSFMKIGAMGVCKDTPRRTNVEYMYKTKSYILKGRKEMTI